MVLIVEESRGKPDGTEGGVSVSVSTQLTTRDVDVRSEVSNNIRDCKYI